MKDFYKLINDDSFNYLQQMEDNSVDSIVTDPPYGLNFMGKDWDKPENIAFNYLFWKECLRVLKPGGHLLAFSGSRTYHRMVVAIEDAGFEIRDQLMWIYGSGMPKSQNIGKLIEKRENKNNIQTKKSLSAGKPANIGNYTRGNQETNNLKREYDEVIPTIDNAIKWFGWGSTLKPAHEPIVMARKPIQGSLIDNILKHNIGALNVDESRIGERFPSNVIHDNSDEIMKLFPHTKAGGSITKDTYEIKNQVYGKGWGNANLHQSYGDSGSVTRFFYGSKCSKKDRDEGLQENKINTGHLSGAVVLETYRNEYNKNKNILTNNHPTVKPTDLMSYLVRLITPSNGIILDPFNGSGSTGKAIAYLNKTQNKNYKYIGIELDEFYIKVSKARIDFAIDNTIWLETKQ